MKLTRKFLDEWQQFEHQVINPQADEIQRTEMRRSFYAGALSIIVLLDQMDDTVSDEDGMMYMSKIKEEIDVYLFSLIPPHLRKR